MSGLVMGQVFYTDLPAHLKLTLLALADHAEDDGSGIFVGQARLARKTGASERAVRGHIAELREMGLIEKVGRVGSRGSDKHRVVVEKLPTSEQIALMFPPRARPENPADRQPAADRKSSASSTGSPAHPRPAIAVAAEPSVEPSEEPSLEVPASFDKFWRTYPRRQGKGDAKRAFTKAVKKAGLATILAGAERLRDDPNLPLDDPSLIPMPATWLNQERWEDDPLPLRQRRQFAEHPLDAMARRHIEEVSNGQPKGREPSSAPPRELPGRSG